MEREDDTLLTNKTVAQLRACGHFLHYRTGGRAGRRRILTTLSEHQELLQRELQDILEVQSGSLSEIVIKMEEDGLIQKVRSEKDGRHFVLKLTQKGMMEAERSKRDYEDRTEKMMSCFSDTQLEELHGLLDIMLTHWRENETIWDSPTIQEKRENQNRIKNEKNE